MQKTICHGVVTLEHGPFSAKETVLVCVKGCTTAEGKQATLRSAALVQRVARGAIFGYDVEVFDGLDRHLRHRQRLETQGTLRERYGVSMSTGEISILQHRFLEHFESLHRCRTPALRAALAADGGYPLHIDATGEDGRGTLLAAYSGWRGWVFGAWKLATERSDLILPRLHEVVEDFGLPCGIVRDLGKAVIAACEELASDLKADFPILSCHRHLLADIGKDLLAKLHDKLRGLFRQSSIRPELRALCRDLGRRVGEELPVLRDSVCTWAEAPGGHRLPAGNTGLAVVRALAQWALDYAQDGHRGDFPFEQPYLDLYLRCRKLRRACDAYLRSSPESMPVRQTLGRLARILEPVVAERVFEVAATKLADRAALLDELRETLRITRDGRPMTSADIIPVQQATAELTDIQSSIEALSQSLRNRRPQRGPAEDTREAIDLVLEHLDRHGDSLWGHVVLLPAELGGGVRIIPRTNNVEESFWHRMKHDQRRRSGRKILTRDFEALPAAAALVYNLNCPDYVELLCGSIKRLPSAFAQLDQRRRAVSTPTSAGSRQQPELALASVSRDDLPVVRSPSLGKEIEAAARSRPPRFVVAQPD
ncbi:MAG: hypothetical protein HY814_01490 [Candidatus Riflebacteria bacterium]|nr:hypothetical protein [Candidatus Riflebacteria bacterium]